MNLNINSSRAFKKEYTIHILFFDNWLVNMLNIYLALILSKVNMQKYFTCEWACLSCICSAPVPKLDYRDLAVLSINQGISSTSEAGKDIHDTVKSFHTSL